MGKPEKAVILGLWSSAVMNGDIGLSGPSTGTAGLPTENWGANAISTLVILKTLGDLLRH